MWNARSRSNRRRRANYSLMVAAATVALLAMGAMTIDVSYMRLAQAQSQDVADAAAHAALVVLRQTGDQARARAAAEAVVRVNRVAGRAATLDELTFGHWDSEDEDPILDTALENPNAVRAVVSRRGDDAVPTALGRLLGVNEFDVAASATAAARSTQVILVMDITNSWNEGDFLHAREASLVALDMMAKTASGMDEMGMTIFTNRFAWEYTPLTRIAVSAAANRVEEDWRILNTASKAGVDSNRNDGRNCKLHGGSRINDFNYGSVGGCYPAMPREYRDEPGTDHSTGISLARQMFEESPSTVDYRAMIVLTDGRPNGLGAPGHARARDGYEETRWREYLGPAPRSTNDIRHSSVEACEGLWNDLNVHTWVVSFVADDWMMEDMVQGDGYYVRTSNPAELEEIFAQIMSELPLALVE